MKLNFYFLNFSVENSYLFKNGNPLPETEKRNVPQQISQEAEKNYLDLEFIKKFWNRLVYRPNSFKQMGNSSIASILEEENDILTSNVIKTVLAEKLELAPESSALSKAVKNSTKIFHEDYPYDFILEYQGERLGMMWLDFCYNSKNESEPIFKFNPDIKSFEGLF